ncbi:MAG: TIGR01906 family membrane protein [SAR202 cluster bacterium]|jgi:integral membrane protein (TIGR01906 family)|nr:TIGR01906 family membrane protein [SAR202 cluster bacterium]
MTYLKPLMPVAIALFIVLVPVFLITANVRLVINLPALYSYGYDRYEDEITRYMNIEREDYIDGGRQIRDYFNNDAEELDVRVVVGGILRSIYSEREVLHMSDVKDLVRGVYRLGELSALYLFAFAVAGMFFEPWRRSLHRTAWHMAMGGAVTLGLVVLVGLGVLAGFERLFLAFHEVSFSNDLWQLNPRTDYLIAMFPEGFFFDATILVAVLIIVQSTVLVVPRWVGAAWRCWRFAGSTTTE